MVVVVPALAEREHGEHGVVARIVAGLVALVAPDVRERVDAERDVPDDHEREEVPVEQRRRATDEVEDEAPCDGDEQIVAIEPAQPGYFAVPTRWSVAECGPPSSHVTCDHQNSLAAIDVPG
jgi:hypothetical protein